MCFQTACFLPSSHTAASPIRLAANNHSQSVMFVSSPVGGVVGFWDGAGDADGAGDVDGDGDGFVSATVNVVSALPSSNFTVTVCVPALRVFSTSLPMVMTVLPAFAETVTVFPSISVSV